MARTKTTGPSPTTPFLETASSRFGKNVRADKRSRFLKAVACRAMRKVRSGAIAEHSGDKFTARGVKNMMVLRGKALPLICRSKVTKHHFADFCEDNGVASASVTVKVDSVACVGRAGKAVTAVHVCASFAKNPNSKHVIRSAELTEFARAYYFRE